MYRELGVESDGQLYKMQQDAIRRAKEAAASAHLKPPERERVEHGEERNRHNEEHHGHSAEHGIIISEREKHNLLPLGNITKLLKNIKSEDLLLIGLLFLLINEGAEDELVLIILFILFSGFNFKPN